MERNGGLAGMIGPAVFALIVVVLTVLQYDFMVRLGWAPVGVSDVPWPSALALDPYGFLQVLNFVLFGVMLMVFAAGLQRGVALSGRVSWAGPRPAWLRQASHWHSWASRPILTCPLQRQSKLLN